LQDADTVIQAVEAFAEEKKLPINQAQQELSHHPRQAFCFPHLMSDRGQARQIQKSSS
jgi:hypothetical protein